VPGEPDLDGKAAAGVAQQDSAVGALDDGVHDRQAEA
jgi:hypothetical protein